MRSIVLTHLLVVAVGFVWQSPRIQRGNVRRFELVSAIADTAVEENSIEEVVIPEEVVDSDEEIVDSDEEVSSTVEKKEKVKEGIPISEIEIGASYEGTVVAVLSYGCFIDIGAQSDGLCHISELSSKFVEDINEVVSVGDTVTARVLKIDEKKKQIALSLKPESSESSPPRGRRGNKPKKAGAEDLRKYVTADPAEEIDGEVVTIKPFGAFVRIEDGVDGLVHISRIADERVNNVEDFVQIGQKVKVRVIDVDLDKVTLALAMDTYRPPRAQAQQDNDQGGGAMNARARRAYGAQEKAGSSAPRKPKRMDPGDDIWETKDSEKFDWQSAMEAAQGDQNDLASGFKVDLDGKITMQ
eukprot:CAMPEP_0197286360 /NCGR_PEP_ID=MMETSP0890-20130614/1788_1 /TAXON_ID=44058 ORGANISM="Aureoumbra lagunensis, Strain CCMP1510" /NCGR_SAMPLE_ID=MMETSP0890 /ASSEMBLY_ACC=CAM_ASM_000533 /LENGTH=355 /DNA_ID=CAMNT_0042754629 /DNA_START=41 /DNA_END=1108 /DNA_ORIENTATION=+